MRAFLAGGAGLLAVLGLAAAPAVAAPAITELAAPIKPPTAIATGADNRLWITETANPGYVGRMSTSGTDLVELAGGGPQGLPLDAAPYDIAAGEDGAVWVTLAAGSAGIARITTADAVTTPITGGYTPGAAPHGIAWGPDGHVWFTESANDAIAELDPATGLVQEHPITVGSAPEDIVAGPDGAMWYTAPGINGIGRMEVDPGLTPQIWAAASVLSAPYGIAAGPDGALWFTEKNADRIGRIEPSLPNPTDFTVTGLSQPTGIVAGGDGALWVMSSGGTGGVFRVATDHSATTGFAGLTASRVPGFATTGPDGNVWFAQQGTGGQVAQVTVAPAVPGSPVSAVTHDSATLLVRVRPNAQATTYRIQLGATTAYGKQTTSLSAGSGWPLRQIAVTLLNLTPSTHYHARVVATNGAGTTAGPDVSFTTADAPPPPPPPGAQPPADVAPDDALPPDVDPGTPVTTPDGLEPEAPGAPLSVPLTAPPPELGKSVGLTEVKGTVKIRDANGRFVPLDGTATLPPGTVIDASQGTVELRSAVDAAGNTQTGQFWGGTFQVNQSRGGNGMTELRLAGGSFATCAGKQSAKASAAARKPPRRGLWGSDSNGRFQSRGRGSVATVRGTKWYTEDRCQGTMTHVLEGAVEVRDLRKKRTVLITALHSYLARVRQR